MFDELKAKKLHYVFDKNEKEEVDKITLENDENTVRDIIFNRINLNDYENDFIHLIDSSPQEILDAIKDTKLGEINLDEHTAFKNLINKRFNPKKENTVQYISRFEKTVRTYENHCETGKISG